jgi:hypothetical protein
VQLRRRLAANLYAKDTRFVYELLQNAEDNGYSLAADPPWLHFAIHQDRIVIDSNEDGFSKANIKVICSISESTKTSVRGYIGEKGIGFKSVFKVAHKVHVQSGPYSFAFEYQRDGNDNDLGMVTPMSEGHLDVPDGERTRMTLHLLESCNKATLYKGIPGPPRHAFTFSQETQALVNPSCSTRSCGCRGPAFVVLFRKSREPSQESCSFRLYTEAQSEHAYSCSHAEDA